MSQCSGTGFDVRTDLTDDVPGMGFCFSELYEVLGTGTNSGTDVHTGTGGAGIDVVPNLPKCPVPVLMYRTYRRVRYR